MFETPSSNSPPPSRRDVLRNGARAGMGLLGTAVFLDSDDAHMVPGSSFDVTAGDTAHFI